MSEKVKELKDIKLDEKNFNVGTEKGKKFLEKSLKDFGAGRSILIDKHNQVIAGNKTLETFKNLGNKEVEIVETDGSKLIAVKRNDIDLNSDQGRLLAFADNYTSEANLEWDFELLSETIDEDTLSDWDFEAPYLDVALNQNVDEQFIESEIDDVDLPDIDESELSNQHEREQKNPEQIKEFFDPYFVDKLEKDLATINPNLGQAILKLCNHVQSNFKLTEEERDFKFDKLVVLFQNKEEKEKVVESLRLISQLASDEEKDRAHSSVGTGILTALRLYKST